MSWIASSWIFVKGAITHSNAAERNLSGFFCCQRLSSVSNAFYRENLDLLVAMPGKSSKDILANGSLMMFNGDLPW